jgi:hypothetical protein
MLKLKFAGLYPALGARETKAGDCRNRPCGCQGNCCVAVQIAIRPNAKRRTLKEIHMSNRLAAALVWILKELQDKDAKK